MNSDVLVDAAVAEALDVAMPARPLGSRGSRGDVAEDSPAELTPTAVAVLAAIPAWWASRAEAAGLSGRWADVELALEVAPPVPLPTNPPLRASWGSLTPTRLAARTSRRCRLRPGRATAVTTRRTLWQRSCGRWSARHWIWPLGCNGCLDSFGIRPAVRFWVVEAVATDGLVTTARRDALLRWAAQQNIAADRCSFLSAFESRNAAPAKRRPKDLASGTWAWFADEPAHELAWYQFIP